MRDVFITDHHIISSLGFDTASNFKNLTAMRSGIKEHKSGNGETYFTSLVDKGKVDKLFSAVGDVNQYTLLEKMMILSVDSVLRSSGLKISDRTGLLIASTKGNIDVLSEDSVFHNDENRACLPELGNRISDFFGFNNEAIVLSNACVSGVLALAVAKRMIRTGYYDEVVVVGGDLVSEFILSGFMSFQAISDQPCRPFSKNRSGITIGEATACALVTSDKGKIKKGSVQILGGASSNDANHISGPSRTGEGLFLSVSRALKEAGLKAENIDYISAHGTATNYNDEMESIAFDRLGMLGIPLNSLKGYYGHTLGASGLLESIIGIESLNHNTLIASLGFDEMGVSKPVNVITKTTPKALNIFLKTASGFGGCNTAVLFKKVKTIKV